MNTADKITTTSSTTSAGTVNGTYAYDALGRVTTLPVVDTITGTTDSTLTYRADDTVDSITSDGTTQAYTYDLMGRRLAATSTGTVAKTLTRGYADTSDNPAYTTETTPVTGGTRTTTTRYLSGLGVGLGATTDTITASGAGTSTSSTLLLADLRGNTPATITLPSTGSPAGIDSWQSTDEYGNPTTPATGPTPAGGATPAHYNWHGTDERSADTPTGLTLMGARLYNPDTGTFSTIDPLMRGNDTTYGHPSDPINREDLSGLCNDESLACLGRILHNRTERKPDGFERWLPGGRKVWEGMTAAGFRRGEVERRFRWLLRTALGCIALRLRIGMCYTRSRIRHH